MLVQESLGWNWASGSIQFWKNYLTLFWFLVIGCTHEYHNNILYFLASCYTVLLFHVVFHPTCQTHHSLAATQSQALDTQYFYGRSSVLIKGVQGPKFQILQSPFWLLFVQPIGILTPCFSDFELKAWKSRIASLNTLSVGEVLRISLIILRFQCSVAVSFKAWGPIYWHGHCKKFPV